MVKTLKSRKFWASLGATVVLFAGPQLGLDPTMAKWIAGILGTFTVAQGIADSGKADSSQH